MPWNTLCTNFIGLHTFASHVWEGCRCPFSTCCYPLISITLKNKTDFFVKWTCDWNLFLTWPNWPTVEVQGPCGFLVPGKVASSTLLPPLQPRFPFDTDPAWFFLPLSPLTRLNQTHLPHLPLVFWPSLCAPAVTTAVFHHYIWEFLCLLSMSGVCNGNFSLEVIEKSMTTFVWDLVQHLCSMHIMYYIKVKTSHCQGDIQNIWSATVWSLLNTTTQVIDLALTNALHSESGL